MISAAASSMVSPAREAALMTSVARILALMFAGAAMASVAHANDSTAELGTGGLNLVRNEEVDLLSEDLRVSRDAIRVTYHFRNHTDAPVTYLVAFPLPAIDPTTE